MVTTSLTVQDILPYSDKRSSGKKFDVDALLPFLILPGLLIVATISRTITIIVMVVIGMGVLYVHSRPQQKNRSPFFFSWTLSSGISMFLIYEISILSLLEITQLENFIFLVFLVCTCYFFYKMKAVADFELATGSSKGKEYSPVLTADSKYCQICQIEVNDRFFHSIWWDCCVLRPNYIYFLVGHIFAFATLILGTNLGLTTVCQPYILYDMILIPEDCNDVYYEFDLALSFVGCVYGVGYLFVIALVLLHQLLVYIPKYSELPPTSSYSGSRNPCRTRKKMAADEWMKNISERDDDMTSSHGPQPEESMLKRTPKKIKMSAVIKTRPQKQFV